jgi:NAD(P)-dependent dehydrogenase (short-subunit alcohol dehydrogenase family)
LDAAFNNAGFSPASAALTAVDEESFTTIVSVNVVAVYLCMKHQIPAMLRSGGGAIVNTSSISGLVGTPGLGAYTAAKHAVIGLTKSTAIEFGERGIRVNALAPGPTLTEMFQEFAPTVAAQRRVATETAMNRLGRPEEIAHAAVWLCSDEASYVTGATLPVDGGHTAR